jgi:hypothetical protein
LKGINGEGVRGEENSPVLAVTTSPFWSISMPGAEWLKN